MKIHMISLIILGTLFIGLVSAYDLTSLPRTGGMTVRCLDGNYYEWEWHVNEVDDYYRIVHILTGWDINTLDYHAAIHPEDLVTMPEEMYHTFKVKQTPWFGSLSGTMTNDNDERWEVCAWKTFNNKSRHIWVSPENEVFTGNAPPYQFLVWKGWEAYADRLPDPPPGAPFPPPPYGGTPKNTLPLAKIPSGWDRNMSTFSNPYPDAIAEDPLDGGYWEWTPEMSERLGRIGLDPDMRRTRLGYEKSPDGSVTVVGMTPAGVMKTWTVTPSGKNGWTIGKDQPASEDLLWILRAVEAIPDDVKTAVVPTGNTPKISVLAGIQQVQSGTGFTTPVVLRAVDAIPYDVGTTVASGNIPTVPVMAGMQQVQSGTGFIAPVVLQAGEAIPDNGGTAVTTGNTPKVSDLSSIQVQSGTGVTAPVTNPGVLLSDGFRSVTPTTSDLLPTVSGSFTEPPAFQDFSAPQFVSENNDGSADETTTNFIGWKETGSLPAMDFQYHTEASASGFVNGFSFAAGV